MKTRTNTLELGIVSDEISNDFAEAMQYASSWGISLVEIRLLKSGRVPDVDKRDIEEVQQYLRRGVVRITALSPGIFKHPLSHLNELKEELAVALPRTIEMAKTLNAPLIIVFGFKREEGEPQSRYNIAVDFLRRAASIAERAGLKLAIENEPGFWCDTGANTRKLIDDVRSRALGANWDPANAYGTTELPYPDGYLAVRDRIFNVHAKDTKQGSLVQCVPIGEGVLDWDGQMSALMHDNVVSHVTIETHCLPLIENSRRNVDALRQMINEIPRTA
ncbi:MAG: sugar phosphate isomerase/epimerase [Ignavibacteriae bacterium]|nr:sugar phosphate isomerase/epimerase [Ignavibacteriota bacterium]